MSSTAKKLEVLKDSKTGDVVCVKHDNDLFIVLMTKDPIPSESLYTFEFFVIDGPNLGLVRKVTSASPSSGWMRIN